MRLRVITPLAIVVDADPVLALRAEDESGGFGILPGHADFLTSLTIGVVSWKDGTEKRRYCAVRRGVLVVEGGKIITITTREAVLGDDLATLDATVIASYRAAIEAERTEHADALRRQLAAIRRIAQQLDGRNRKAGLA